MAMGVGRRRLSAAWLLVPGLLVLALLMLGPLLNLLDESLREYVSGHVGAAADAKYTIQNYTDLFGSVYLLYIADTFRVWSAGKISDSTGSLFKDQVTSPQAIAVQVAGLAIVVCAFRLPWAKWLGLPDATDGAANADAEKRQPRAEPSTLPREAAH